MDKQEKFVSGLFKEALPDVIGGEDLVIEAARDMIRDEIKAHIKKKLQEDPKLRQELKDAIGMYFEAKIKEAYASVKLAKAGAMLGLKLVPDDIKDELSKEIEHDISKILEGIF